MDLDTHELVTEKIAKARGIAWVLRELSEREDEHSTNALWAITGFLDEADGLLEKAWRAQQHSRIDSEAPPREAA